ncbi:hypothetical protein [Agrobacterium tumefaciens]|uniref:hypothetical protein n=1 Tax=Agrobacterium tumefaciens TaxID=358 RepID=UPI0021FE4006|nr:hypothetical protein FY157_15505 [Agrobacterium tumefaciens]
MSIEKERVAWRSLPLSVPLVTSWKRRWSGSLYSAIILTVLGGLVVFANGGEWLGLATACIILSAIGWGKLISRAFGYVLFPEMQLLIGSTVTAYILALPVYYFNISILFPGLCLLLGNLGFLMNRGQREEGKPSLSWFLAIAAVAGFSIIWSLDSTSRYALLEQGRLRLWLDLFIHAGTIAEFGDPKTAGRGLSALVDTAPTFYHFASYALPGLMVRILRLSPADVITAFWFPFGIFLTVTSIFALGRILAGIAGGSLALMLFAVLPDAAAYGLKQGFLSFHWMMEASPGTLYALPAALASVGILTEWSRRGGVRYLGLACSLLLSTFLLRAHIFMWLLVPFAVVIVAALPAPVRRFRWHLIILGAIALPIALLWIARGEVRLVGYSSFMSRFLELLHTHMEPTNYDGFYAYLIQSMGPVGALPIGLLLALVGMAGIWLLTFLSGFSIALWYRGTEEIDWLPAALLPYACVLMTLAPTPFNGDFTEFRQRAFVLVYVLLIIWTAKFTVLFSRVSISPTVAGFAALLALISAGFWMPYAKVSRMAWGASYDNVEIIPGVVSAARWIKQEGRRGDSIAVANTKPDEKLFDIPTTLMSISGVPAYLSRPGLYALSGYPRSETVKSRLAELSLIHNITSATEAQKRLRNDGIGFYVTLKTDMPSWDKEGSISSLKVGDIAIWRIQP